MSPPTVQGGRRCPPNHQKKKKVPKKKKRWEEPFGEATRKWYRSLAEDVQAHNLRVLHGMLAG